MTLRKQLKIFSFSLGVTISFGLFLAGIILNVWQYTIPFIVIIVIVWVTLFILSIKT